MALNSWVFVGFAGTECPISTTTKLQPRNLTMKPKLLPALLPLAFALAGSVSAQPGLSDRVAFEPGTALFSPNEISLDLFGYHASRDKGNSPNDAWGPGVGVNYYITQN